MMTIYGRVIFWPSLYMRMISLVPIGDYRTTLLIGTVYTPKSKKFSGRTRENCATFLISSS